MQSVPIGILCFTNKLANAIKEKIMWYIISVKSGKIEAIKMSSSHCSIPLSEFIDNLKSFDASISRDPLTILFIISLRLSSCDSDLVVHALYRSYYKSTAYWIFVHFRESVKLFHI